LDYDSLNGSASEESHAEFFTNVGESLALPGIPLPQDALKPQTAGSRRKKIPAGDAQTSPAGILL